MYSLLLVDNDEALLNTLMYSVGWEELGFAQIDCAYDGLQALRMLCAHPHDLVITDIQMPGMNGLEFFQRAKESALHARFIMLTAYNEFDYALTSLKLGAADYLLKPISPADLAQSVRTTMDFNAPQRNYANGEFCFLDHFLRHWAYGNLSQQELLSRAAKADVNLFLPCYNIAMAFSTKGKPDFSLLESAASVLRARWTVWEFDDSNQIHTFIVAGEACDDGNVLACLAPLAASELCSFAAGRAVTIYDELPYAYSTCAKRQQLYNLLLAGKTAAQKAAPPESSSMLPKLDIDRILDLNAAPELELRQYWEQIKNRTGGSWLAIHSLASEIVLNIIRKLSKNPAAQRHVADTVQSLLQQLNELTTIEQIEAWLLEIIATVRGALSQSSSACSPIVLRAQQYIDAHFAEEISIKGLASMFAINPNYLGFLFHEETRTYFTDYLNRARIRHAMELLRNTDKSISIIASLSGYINVNYFNRAFKRYIGISPTKYRSESRENEE